MAIDVDLVGTDQDVCDVHSCRSGIYIDPHRSRWIQANVKFYFFWGGGKRKVYRSRSICTKFGWKFGQLLVTKTEQDFILQLYILRNKLDVFFENQKDASVFIDLLNLDLC